MKPGGRWGFLGRHHKPRLQHQINRARRTTSQSGRKPALFAYPWTQASDYMRRDYMPQFAATNGVIAAFGGQSDYLTQRSDRWYLPRFVFGPDWKSADGLRAILRGALD